MDCEEGDNWGGDARMMEVMVPGCTDGGGMMEDIGKVGKQSCYPFSVFSCIGRIKIGHISHTYTGYRVCICRSIEYVHYGSIECVH